RHALSRRANPFNHHQKSLLVPQLLRQPEQPPVFHKTLLAQNRRSSRFMDVTQFPKCENAHSETKVLELPKTSDLLSLADLRNSSLLWEPLSGKRSWLNAHMKPKHFQLLAAFAYATKFVGIGRALVALAVLMPFCGLAQWRTQTIQ